MARPFQVMTKPNGPRCNLDCTYCYYLEKERLYPSTKKFQMADDVLETFIRDYIAAQHARGVPEIQFMWQGGEPTILGVDYFRRVVELQAKYRPEGATVTNAIQTNGTLLNEEWARFLRAHDFLVGLSIDGPRELHDKYRIDRQDAPTFDKVMAAMALLKEHEVRFNTLTVVHRRNSRHPREVYRFLRDAGSEFMQFIPIVERSPDGEILAGAPPMDEDGVEYRVTPWSVLPKVYGSFLCGVFDEWITADVGRVFVQYFDVQLGLWLGQPAGLCWFAETCGQGMAMEHNGDLYACDHYVYAEYLLGNIMEQSLESLAGSAFQQEFSDAKRDSLPRLCRECEFRFACNGGCPKHRFLTTPDGEPGLNYFCQSQLAFFRHAGPHLRTMAELLRHGRAPAEIMRILAQGAGPRPAAGGTPRRNDPCPCGSGRKYKNCCGAARTG